MDPERDGHAVVDLVDVLLEDGAVLSADVMISVAEVPLVGIRLRLLLAGMTELTRRGVFEEWDRRHRQLAADSSVRDGDASAREADAGSSTPSEVNQAVDRAGTTGVDLDS